MPLKYRLSFPLRWYGVLKQSGLRALFKYIFKFPRKFVPTKAGWIFFAFMIAIMIFAFTTNNNLLFLLFSAMMSLMIISGFMSESSLGKIKIRQFFPEDIFAKSQFSAQFKTTNFNRYFGAYAFYVRDKWLFNDGMGPIFIHLAAGKTKTLTATAMIRERGKFTLPVFELVTQYPFLLFSKSKEISGSGEIIVYPALHKVDLSTEQLFGSGEGGYREQSDGGDILSYIREYQRGESLRKIDWKKSAKLDNLYVKEFAGPETKRVAVMFVPGSSKDFEQGIEMTASLVVWLYNQKVPYILSLDDDVAFKYECSYEGLRRNLKKLALYHTVSIASVPGDAHRIMEVQADGSYYLR